MRIDRLPQRFEIAVFLSFANATFPSLVRRLVQNELEYELNENLLDAGALIGDDRRNKSIAHKVSHKHAIICRENPGYKINIPTKKNYILTIQKQYMVNICKHILLFMWTIIWLFLVGAPYDISVRVGSSTDAQSFAHQSK